MFNQLYKDMEELHRLVKPLRYRVTLDRWNDSLDSMKSIMGALIVSTIQATQSAAKFNEAMSEIKKAQINAP